MLLGKVQTGDTSSDKKRAVFYYYANKCYDYGGSYNKLFLKAGVRMMDKLNKRLTKLMPILTPLSLVLGVIFEDIGAQLGFLVAWLFAFMTFAGSLSLDFQALKVFTRYPYMILLTIVGLHVIMPLWAYLVSTFLFHDELLTFGFILSVAVPTGVTSFIWVSISRGNKALCLSIILIDTLLAPLVMPAIVHIVVGKAIDIDMSSLIVDLVWMVVLPSVLGMLLNEYTHGRIENTLGQKLAPFSKLALFSIVFINSSVIAPYVREMSWELVHIIVVVFFIAVSGYILWLLLGHFIWRDPTIVSTLVFTGGMRNIAIGVVIASSYFPPKVGMPVVFGMLFQQIIASQFSRIVEKYRQRMTPADNT